MTKPDTAWALASEPPDTFTQRDIIQRCDRIQALHPDLKAWDPVGRGPSAPPAQWLLDLILLAGLGQIRENRAGSPARFPMPARDFYLKMALELSSRAAPDCLLRIDGKTPPPPGLEMAQRVSWQTMRAHQFHLAEGDALDALLDPWLMRAHNAPHSKSALLQLTLNMLDGVRLTAQEGAGAIKRLLSSNRCFNGPGDVFTAEETERLVCALASATPGFHPNALELDYWRMSGLKEYNPSLLPCFERLSALAEAQELSDSIRQPSTKSTAPRV